MGEKILPQHNSENLFQVYRNSFPLKPSPTFLSNFKGEKNLVNRSQGFKEMDKESCRQEKSMRQEEIKTM